MGFLGNAHSAFVKSKQVAGQAREAIKQQHDKVDSSYNHRFFEKRSDYKKFKTVLAHYGIEEENIDISGSQGDVLNFSLQCRQFGQKLTTSSVSYTYDTKSGFLENSYLKKCFNTSTDYEDFLDALRQYNIDPNFIRTIQHSATCIIFPLRKTTLHPKKVAEMVYTYNMREKILTEKEISVERT